jgi:hypothetical protein
VQGSPWDYHDLDGNAIEVLEDNAWLRTVRLPAQLTPRRLGGAVSWGYRLWSFNDRRHPLLAWFFVADGRAGGAGYFAGYDRTSKRCVGYLGTAGPRDAMPSPEECFALPSGAQTTRQCVHSVQDGWRIYGVMMFKSERASAQSDIEPWYAYVQTEDGVYQIDLSRQTAVLALPGESVLSSGLLRLPREQTEVDRLVARTTDAVVVLNGRNQVLRRAVIPPELRSVDFAWTETSANEALYCWTVDAERDQNEESRSVMPADDAPLSMSGQMHYEMCRADAAGQITWRAGVDLQKGSSQAYLRYLLGLFAPSPLLADFYVSCYRTKTWLSSRTNDTYGQALGQALDEFWPALVIIQLLAAGLTWAVYRRQVRYPTAHLETVGWMVLVFVLGLPGWIGYRFARSWPALEICPECSDPAPQDRSVCAACGAEFPMPALKGTEVFA